MKEGYVKLAEHFINGKTSFNRDSCIVKLNEIMYLIYQDQIISSRYQQYIQLKCTERSNAVLFRHASICSLTGCCKLSRVNHVWFIDTDLRVEVCPNNLYLDTIHKKLIGKFEFPLGALI